MRADIIGVKLQPIDFADVAMAYSVVGYMLAHLGLAVAQAVMDSQESLMPGNFPPIRIGRSPRR